MTDPRVLVVHNRYRIHGGEERAVDLQVAALRRAGVPYATFFRDSAEAGKVRAARSLVRGGEAPDELRAAVRDAGAQVAHFHNMHPLLGSRALAAARHAAQGRGAEETADVPEVARRSWGARHGDLGGEGEGLALGDEARPEIGALRQIGHEQDAAEDVCCHLSASA